MRAHTPSWTIKSNAGDQTMAGGLALTVGLLLVVGFHGAPGPGMSDERAGLLLGVLMLLAGLGLLLFGRRQVITVDRTRQRIVIARVGRFTSRRREISFAEVIDVQLGELGDSEGGSVRYHVDVSLRSGERIALFMGFFDDTRNKAVVQGRCDQLQRALTAAA